MFDKMSERAANLRVALAGVSAAAWIALATFSGLLMLTGLAWLLAWNNPVWVPWGTYLTLTRGLSLLGMAILACAAEYLLFRIWFDETPIPDRELRAGWTAGLRHLAREGIRLQSLPCFMLLDPTDACESWFDAAGIRVQRPEASDSPVRWYVAEESLFLVVQKLGCLEPLTKELNEARRRPYRYAMQTYAHQTVPQPSLVTATADNNLATSLELDDPQGRKSADSGFGSIDVHAVREALQNPQSNTILNDSLALDQVDDTYTPGMADIHISSTEIARQSRRLADVCRRLTACRRPVVPVNGIGVLLPDGLLSAFTGTGARLGQALRHDLDLLQQELGVIAPVSVIVVGAEEDAGMIELIRRSGRDQSKGRRLGWGIGPSRATQERVAEFCEEVMRALRSTVGRRLRDPLSVGRPGAYRLFRLMSSLRGDRSEELQALITHGFASEGTREPDLLAEVSIAATGVQPTERAFAGSTYRQLIENQEFVEWTVASRRRERQYRWLAAICGGLSIMAALVLVALLFGDV
ncbi:MAG: hypothetical protein KDA86_03620 [Planctomycetaceae bacterium]|nr:hypothetical protein [Planctomycetaceae bacterium]